MDFYTLILLACAAGFVISAVDYWFDIGFWRVIVVFLVGGVGAYLLGQSIVQSVITGLAAAFLSLSLIQIIERINYRVVRR